MGTRGWGLAKVHRVIAGAHTPTLTHAYIHLSPWQLNLDKHRCAAAEEHVPFIMSPWLSTHVLTHTDSTRSHDHLLHPPHSPACVFDCYGNRACYQLGLCLTAQCIRLRRGRQHDKLLHTVPSRAIQSRAITHHPNGSGDSVQTRTHACRHARTHAHTHTRTHTSYIDWQMY